ncbi:hypothetical protein SteCoe_35914 [Stentor coeruleus]|uniref:Uncharacterized protein n=1 Tax=Stentor coeruleus TaxID=5963 RepID=A0A1R2AR87_9CILI|nr:hypothetical protein SteCoe_35914 [Stentor coeruleus]
MGCCKSTRIDSELIFTQINTSPDIVCEDAFNEIPLSSQPSPMRFALAQEERQNSTLRLSYETTTFSSIPYPKLSLELAFVCGNCKY